MVSDHYNLYGTKVHFQKKLEIVPELEAPLVLARTARRRYSGDPRFVHLPLPDLSEWNIELDAVLGVNGQDNRVTYIGVSTELTTPAGDPLPVVVKIVNFNDLTWDSARRGYENELNKLQGLSHEQVPSLLFCMNPESTNEKWIGIAMEYIEGTALDEFGSYSLEDIAAVAASVLPVLVALQRNKICHMDIKPPNLLRRPDGSVAVVDFGVAKTIKIDPAIKGSTVLGGTPAFSKPEVMLGEDPDEATDLYSLGNTLAALLLGYSTDRYQDEFGSGDLRKTKLKSVLEKFGAHYVGVEAQRWQCLKQWILSLILQNQDGSPQNAQQALNQLSRFFDVEAGRFRSALPEHKFVSQAKLVAPKKTSKLVPLVSFSVMFVIGSVLNTAFHRWEPTVTPPSDPAVQIQDEQTTPVWQVALVLGLLMAFSGAGAVYVLKYLFITARSNEALLIHQAGFDAEGNPKTRILLGGERGFRIPGLCEITGVPLETIETSVEVDLYSADPFKVTLKGIWYVRVGHYADDIRRVSEMLGDGNCVSRDRIADRTIEFGFDSLKRLSHKMTLESLLNEKRTFASLVADDVRGSLDTYGIEVVGFSIQEIVQVMVTPTEGEGILDRKVYAEQQRVLLEVEASRRKMQVDREKEILELEVSAEQHRQMRVAEHEAQLAEIEARKQADKQGD